MSAVAIRQWCRMYGCSAEPAEGSEFCLGHQHAANEVRRPLVSPSIEPGPAEPAPSPEGEPKSAGGGARYRPPVKWTREKVVAAIREVGENVGRTPSLSDMKEAGYVSVTVNTTLGRLDTTWAELVVEAGYEPRVRGSGNGLGRDGADGKHQSRPEDSEREPQAETRAPRSHASSRPAASGATSRSDDPLRALALAARAFADAILEETA